MTKLIKEDEFMDKTKRIVGALVACAMLGGCQGGGSGGSGSSNPNQTTSQNPGGSGSPSVFGQSTSSQTTLLLVPSGTRSLGVYLRDPWTGTIVDRGYVQTGQTPSAIAVSGGRYVYVANSGSGTISAYDWQSTTNRLVSLGPDVTSGSGGLGALAVVGDFLYAVNTSNNTIAIFTIGASGQLTAANAQNTPALTGAVAGTNGILYGLETTGIIPYATSADGTLTPGAATTVSNTIIGGTTDAAGNLYALTTAAVHSYAPSGGGLTPLQRGRLAKRLYAQWHNRRLEHGRGRRRHRKRYRGLVLPDRKRPDGHLAHRRCHGHGDRGRDQRLPERPLRLREQPHAR